MIKLSKIISIVFFLMEVLSTNAQQYNWSKVRIGGGGNVISVKGHPKVKDLFFITTDVGTCYRWNKNTEKWENMMEGNIPLEYWTYTHHTSCGDIAIDPNDSTGNIIYASIIHGRGKTPGDGTEKGTILKSYNRGETWTDCELPIIVLPNNDQAYSDRLVVDPQNSNIVFVTTRSDGTFRSDKAGSPGSWKKVHTPFGENTGAFIKFDLSSGVVDGVTKTIYLGAAKEGIFKSEDGGKNFVLMNETPSNVRRASISNDGILYVNFDNGINNTTNKNDVGIAKWDKNNWTDISPVLPNTGQYFSSPAVNPYNSNEVIVATSGTWHHDDIFTSVDGGKNWQKLKTTRDYSEVPFEPGNKPGNNINTFIFDYFNNNNVWFTDWLAVYESKNVWSQTSDWKVRVNGLEEIVVTGPLVCPPSGNNILHSVTADAGGFDHKSLNLPPPVGVNKFFPTKNGINTSTAAIQYTNPDFIVRVGSDGWDGPGIGGYSMDGGKNYTHFKSLPGARGRIAVSATRKKMVWISQEPGTVFYSHDLGNTWQESKGLEKHILKPGSQWMIYAGQNPIVADKVNGDIFYVYHNGNLYISEDAGKSFRINNTTPLPVVANVAIMNIETTPEKEGNIWIAFDGQGLYHSTNKGKKFTKINPDNIQNARWIAVGKDNPNDKKIVLYTFGKIYNIPYALFRSDDEGKSWKPIANPTLSVPLNLAADLHGRVYYGSPGNGIYMGELKNNLKNL